MRRLALVVVCTITAFTVGAVAPSPAIAASIDVTGRKVSYRPPADAPVYDEFRPPPEKWGAGNRGIDYATAAGTPIKASADGEVSFAGQVGGELHVVLLHSDGIRTTYAFLDSIAVHRGDKVRQGQVVGHSGPDGFHFGARIGKAYIDPRTLFDEGPPQVFLVPDELRHPGTEAEERKGLIDYLLDVPKRTIEHVIDAAKDEIGGLIDEGRGLIEYAQDLNPVTQAFDLWRVRAEYERQLRDCTPGDVAARPLPEKRVAVLVGGLGSNGKGNDAVDDVEPPELGYAGSVRFSYRGGTVTENPYEKRDTTTDLRAQGERLRDLLVEMERRHPGVPIDIIAHSQGGIIAREALAHGWDTDDRTLPPVRNIVTLASPHQGTDVATALTMLGHTDIGDAAQKAVDATRLLSTDLQGESVAQLAEHSTFLRDLNRTPLPEGVRLTSIGSRGDLLVPGVQTRVPGGRNVIVSLDGVWSDHSNLPGSAEGRREIALAVAGMPPTCQTFTDMLADHYVATLISTGEDLAGLAAYLGAKRLDKKLEGEEPTRHDPDPSRSPPRSTPPSSVP
ncbi:MAG: peptidoglycan DD-metalloendopeptidase family protein [Acidimicrobiales bacterium]